MSEKFKDLIKFVQNLMNINFTGSIDIHFNNGNIARINKHEVVK